MTNHITALRNGIEKALKEVEKEHNVIIDLGILNHSQERFHIKVNGTFLGNQSKEVKLAKDFSNFMKLRDFDEYADYYGKEILVDNKPMKIIGFKPRSPKNCIKVQCTTDNREYVTSISAIVNAKVVG